MEELINELDIFVNEKAILSAQIKDIENKRNELAKERNTKKLPAQNVLLFTPRHSQSLLMEGFTALSALSAASNASVRRIAHLLRLQDAMLMK